MNELKSNEVTEIREKTKKEIQRRTTKGPIDKPSVNFGDLSSYAGSSYDFSVQKNTPITAEQGNKLIEPLLAAGGNKHSNLKKAIAGQPIPSDFTANKMEKVVDTLSMEVSTGESTKTARLVNYLDQIKNGTNRPNPTLVEHSSCNAACSGLCVGSCAGYCNGCTGCSASCGGQASSSTPIYSNNLLSTSMIAENDYTVNRQVNSVDRLNLIKGNADASKNDFFIHLEQTAYKYTGREIIPNLKIETQEHKMLLNSDVSISYKNNINKGTATVIVSGKGLYEGIVKETFFEIN